ncbi:hypothetical protein A0256_22875 [Mucilaginibacter sp. PAMC 26640]|nr:hypothetical protein A0256_22875 [Mucilaginibacter sp. PAMC 26640]
MMHPLLTIAIPTYNRALLLDQCLNALLSQLSTDLRSRIELIVSDNHSTDHTMQVVEQHIKSGYLIKYHKNQQNLGPDRNIASCFTNATGKYVWIFSDDDFLLPGYLKFIVDLLAKNEWGAVHLNTLWYSDTFDLNPPLPAGISYDSYTEPMAYMARISYWATFITGNIINKSLYADLDFIPEFFDTCLVQLSWTLPALFKGKPSAVVNDKVLACRADNTGGYQLLTVFSKNFNNIMDKLISRGLVDKRIKRVINSNLLHSFFPMFINKPGKGFNKEKPFKVMVPVFWNYKSFWLKIFPVLIKKQLFKNVSV